jgi:hypothetical protein
MRDSIRSVPPNCALKAKPSTMDQNKKAFGNDAKG